MAQALFTASLLVLGGVTPAAAQEGPRGPAARLASPATGAVEVDDGGDGEDDGWHLDLSAVTSVPVTVGVQATVEAPFGLLLAGTLGYTPPAYLGLVAGLLEGAGALESMGRPLVDEATANGAFTLRLSLGYRFVENFEVLAGYTFLTSSSEVSQGALEGALGRDLPGDDVDPVPFGITVHALHVHAVFRAQLVAGLTLRIGLGWTQGLATEIHAELPDTLAGNDRVQRLMTRIRDAVSTYAFTPEVILGLGYRL